MMDVERNVAGFYTDDIGRSLSTTPDKLCNKYWTKTKSQELIKLHIVTLFGLSTEHRKSLPMTKRTDFYVLVHNKMRAFE